MVNGGDSEHAEQFGRGGNVKVREALCNESFESGRPRDRDEKKEKRKSDGRGEGGSARSLCSLVLKSDFSRAGACLQLQQEERKTDNFQSQRPTDEPPLGIGFLDETSRGVGEGAESQQQTESD